MIAGLPKPNRSAIGLLRLLLVASVLIPCLLFVVIAWLNYGAAIASAERQLLRTSEVAREHASKIFEGQSQVADRVNDLVRDMDADTIIRSERSMHDALAAITARLPQVQSVLLAAVDGRPLASAGTYPVPRNIDLRSRDYFKNIVDGHDGTYISSLQFGDVNRQLFFGLSQAWKGPQGEMKGVIDVAILPGYFRDFYAVLIGEGREGPAGRIITLLRDDGQILVRYPPFPGPPPRAPATGPFFTAVHANPEAGVYRSGSIVDSGAPDRIYAYCKVQGYPLYVVAGRSMEAIENGWRHTIIGHLIYGAPLTLALFAVTWTALTRAKREVEALTTAHQEIERRERAEAALLQSQRLEAVGQMTGGVAHDFNNLLTVILGSAELLEKRASDPLRVRRIADQIIMAAQHGGKVTQQLLTFSRRQLVHPETFDLNELLQAFLPLLEHASHEGIRIAFDLSAGLPLVRLDRGHFEAAILNLVGNARDAMPNGGTIRITTRVATEHTDLPPGDYVRVTVADDGTGMDLRTAARAFEPFFTTKDIGKGTGLGLSQVYGFAKQAGGDVRIISAPGHGTAIDLLLPATPQVASSRPATGASLTSRIAMGEVVLVVEDEPAVREMAVESLHDLGYTTLTAGDGVAALATLKGGDRIDVLFSDIVMPGGMTGLQLSNEARRLRPGLKILLTSGYTANAKMDDAVEIPILMKPYDRETLAQSLRDVLQS